MNTVSIITTSWVFLENKSTGCIFSNSEILVNIQQIDSWIDIYCFTGMASINWVGDLPGFVIVWYHKNKIATIISLKSVKEIS